MGMLVSVEEFCDFSIIMGDVVTNQIVVFDLLAVVFEIVHFVLWQCWFTYIEIHLLCDYATLILPFCKMYT